jgi:hypothetical protein
MPKGFKRIRYYGVQAPKAWRQNNVPIHFGLHDCFGSSTLLSAHHPLPEALGGLRSNHGV